MTGYEILVFVHVFAAIVWVGSGVALQVLSLRVLASDDERQIAGFANSIEWMGGRVFAPASITVLLFGVLLVWQSEAWTIGQTWIWLSLVAYAISFVIGTFFLTPQAGKLAGVLEDKGALHPEYQSNLKRILTVSRFEILMLIGVVFLMVTKIGA